MKTKFLEAIALCLAFICGCFVACTDDPGEKPDTGELELGAMQFRLMAEELPSWAETYNETASEPLTVQDITFTVYVNGYESKLESMETETDTYTYDDMTGEYALANGGTLREGAESYTYTHGDVTMTLVDWVEDKTALAQLTGTSHILASGTFPMDIQFTLSLYDDNTFVLSNGMSPTIMEGTWTRNRDDSVGLTGEGITIISSTYTGVGANIELEGNLNGYDFTVQLSGRLVWED